MDLSGTWMMFIRNTVCGLITQAGEQMTDLESQELLLLREAVQECLELLREIRDHVKGWEDEK